MRRCFFDAHLDLACLAVNGRDMTAPLDQLTEAGPHRIGPWAPPSVTLPALIAADVKFILGTIFTEAGGSGPESYPVGDAQRAHVVGRAQLEAYLTWQDDQLIALDLLDVLRDDPHVGEVRGGMGVSEPIPVPIEKRIARLGPKPIHTGILIECADPIRAPDELPWWVDRGVVAVGMAWSNSSRYAAGNGAPAENNVGLSDLGRELVREMDRCGVVHDQSHLSDRATTDLFEQTDQAVIASHSNCRSLLGGRQNKFFQRHLTDETIREIVRRGGVIGLNLVKNFIRFPLEKHERPTIDEAVAHVEHICSIAGNTNHVGLGTDLDGGISANDLSEGIHNPSDLIKIAEALQSRGWTDDQVKAFTHLNWLRFWHAAANSRATTTAARPSSA